MSSNLPAVAGTTAVTDGDLSLGQTHLRPEDIQFPRVKIVQQMSQESVDQLAKPGDLFNTLTSEVYGPTLTIAPIQTFMQRVMLVRELRRTRANIMLASAGLSDLSDGDGLKCRSFDMYQGRGEPGDELWADGHKGCNECPLAGWHKGPGGENEAPICSELYNVAAVTDTGELVILSFSRSSAKTGKKLFSAMRFGARPGVASWASSYTIKTLQQKNAKGAFYVAAFEKLKDSTPTDVMAAAMSWAQQIKGVVINVTPLDEDSAGADDGTDDTEALNTEAKF